MSNRVIIFLTLGLMGVLLVIRFWLIDTVYPVGPAFKDKEHVAVRLPSVRFMDSFILEVDGARYSPRIKGMCRCISKAGHSKCMIIDGGVKLFDTRFVWPEKIGNKIINVEYGATKPLKGLVHIFCYGKEAYR